MATRSTEETSEFEWSVELEYQHRLAEMGERIAAEKLETLKAAAASAKTKASQKKTIKAEEDHAEAERKCEAAAEELKHAQEVARIAKASRDNYQKVKMADSILNEAPTRFDEPLYGISSKSRTTPKRERVPPPVLGGRHRDSAASWDAQTDRAAEKLGQSRLAADSVSGGKGPMTSVQASDSTRPDRPAPTDRVSWSHGKDIKESGRNPNVYSTDRADSAGRGRSGAKEDKRRSSTSRTDSSDASTIKADRRANPQGFVDSGLKAITKAVQAISATPKQRTEWKRQHEKNQALVEYSSVWRNTRKGSWELVTQLGTKEREDMDNVRALKDHQIKRLDHSVKMWERQDEIEKRYTDILKVLGPHPSTQVSRQWLAPIMARQLYQLAKSIKADEDCFSGKVGYDRKNVVSLKRILEAAERVRHEYEEKTKGKKTAQEAAHDVAFMNKVRVEIDQMTVTLDDFKAVCEFSEKAQKAAQNAKQACIDRQAEFQKAFGVSVESLVPDDEL